MAKSILLTSLGAAENNLPVRYFSVRKEFGFDYCDALLDAEAGIKTILARNALDEIIVIGGPDTYKEGDDLGLVSLKNEGSLYSKDRKSFTTYDLLRYRLSLYADELSPDEKTEEDFLTEEVKEKLIRFVTDFREKNEVLKDKKSNRLFDALSQNRETYECFRDALSEAFPEFRDNSGAFMQWVKRYLYAELKPSAKLELLQVNEKVRIRLIPETRISEHGQWGSSMVTMRESIVKDNEDINLYIALNSEDAADTFYVINLLDILVSIPKSNVHLKKILTVCSQQRSMTGIIRDDTDGFSVVELFHAIHSFLNYGKADMIVKIWEKSGVNNESISKMLYAMRHVDVGLSMCNIPEVEGGILSLRKLFSDETFWQEAGLRGMAFNVIAESIREDYGTLLEGSGDIPFIELVKWAYRHQFYQQTLTLIESKAPEKIVKTGMFYYCGDETAAEQITQLLAQQRLELKPYEYYKMDEIDYYFVKNYERSRTRGLGAKGEDPQHVYAVLRAQSVENKDPSRITGLTACDSTETLQNLLFAYYHTADVRNKISHAIASAMTETRLMKSDSDDSSALAWMKDSIDYFIACYEKAEAEVLGKTPNIIPITGEAVRKAAEKLKREKHHA